MAALPDLLFSAESADITTDPLVWPTTVPVGNLVTMGSPSVTTINGQQWASNFRDTSTGFRLDGPGGGGVWPEAIPVNGASIVVAVRPIRNPISDPWNSIVDIFYNRLVLAVKNSTGEVHVKRNGSDFWSGGTTLPNGQITVLSLVVQPDGQFKVFANGAEIMNVTATSAMSSLNPLWGGNPPPSLGFWSYINVGRNQPDGWPVFNGDIGDVSVYKGALEDTDRIALETALTTKYGTAAIYDVEATAGTGGSINPQGIFEVPQGTGKTFTVTPDTYYDVTSVLVNGVESVTSPNAASYTVSNVTADGTVAASFTEWMLTEITGKVTSDGMAGVEDAQVTASGGREPYFATTAADGTYSIRVRPGDSYTVTASKSGFLATPTSLAAGPGDLVGKDFLMNVDARVFEPMFAGRGTGGWRDDTWTIGTRIQTGPSAVSVTKLGYVDRDLNGLNVSHQVGIWDSAGTLLGSVTVPAGTAGELIGDFRYAILSAEITLEANSIYAIGAYTQGDSWPDQSASPGFTQPNWLGFSTQSAIARDGGAGFNNPNPPFGGFDWGVSAAICNLIGNVVEPPTPPPTIAGTVTDSATTDPIYSATVTLSYESDGSDPIAEVSTNSAGEYLLTTPFANETYYLVARKGGHVTSAVVTAVVVETSLTGRNFALAKSATLDPLVSLDAAALSTGLLANWSNAGTLGGTFDSFAADRAPEVVADLAGRKAVVFTQNQDAVNRETLVSTVPTPLAIAGASDWTISTVIYRNPGDPGGENCYMSWSGRDIGGWPSAQYRTAQFCYRDNLAAVHYGADFGFDAGTPAAGEWHTVTITYDGGVEKLYVDGLLQQTRTWTLNLKSNTMMMVGGAYWDGNNSPTPFQNRQEDQYWRFNGAIASLQIFDQALTDDEVASLSTDSSDTDGDGLPDAWEESFFGIGNLSEGPADDFDNDGTDNLTEFRLGLIPNSGSSRFALTGGAGGSIEWPSVTGVTFKIERSTTLNSWDILQASYPGTAGTTSYTDPFPPAGRAFYRVTLNN